MMKPVIRKEDVLLLALYLAICVTIILRAFADETGYRTLDSEYYLELAENLKEGNGFYTSDKCQIPVGKSPQNQVLFAAWPIGYPLMIAFTSAITGLEVFWASKLLNLFLLGLSFLLLRRINSKYAYLLSGAYCTYTMLAVYTYTWSEAPFNFGCLLLVFLLTQLHAGNHINRTIVLLFLTGVFLFLSRYIGFFSFGILALAAVYFWHRRQQGFSLKLFAAAFLLCFLAALYFCVNYYLTGSFSGGDRLANQEPVREFLIKQSCGIMNEFFLVRKHYASGLPDLLFWVTIAAQGAAIGVIVFLLRDDWGNVYFRDKDKVFPRVCFIVAGMYFIILFMLRAISPFDPLDFRLLSPSVLLTLIALLFYVSNLPTSHKHKATIGAVVMCFFIFSLLMNLPKEFILYHIVQFLS